MVNKKIRVLVVDDSIVMREAIIRGITADERIEVVARASDPFEARDKILEYEPDVMTCDVEMPKMNGIEFIKRLLPQYSIPVIIVSGLNNAVFEVLKAGAVDFVAKPSDKNPNNLKQFIEELIKKIKIAATSKVMSFENVNATQFMNNPKQVKVSNEYFDNFNKKCNESNKTFIDSNKKVIDYNNQFIDSYKKIIESNQKVNAPNNQSNKQIIESQNISDSYQHNVSSYNQYKKSNIVNGKLINKQVKENIVIAIGASTGGTEALYNILVQLPENIPGIVIVQHIPPIFSGMLAQRLNNQTQLTVKEAKTGDFVETGTVLIAPGDQHMKVKKVGEKYKVEVYHGEKLNGHCPSVDILFDSIAKEVGRDAIGIILTGMGYDGAKGLLHMKRKGAKTIGQDEKSCVVYGMPKVAYDIGAVEKQVSLEKIPQVLCQILG